MRRAILDTDILSESIKGYDPIVLRNARAYASEHGQFETTSVSVHEVLFGLSRKAASAQAAHFHAWIARNVEHMPLPGDYRFAADIRGAAQMRGRTLEMADCLIAAVAHRLDLPLVTGNLAHYEAMRDAGLTLNLQNWRLVS